MVACFLRNRGGAAHVLIRRVCARANETDLEFLWPSVCLDGLGELRHWGSEIGSERAIDMRLEFREVLLGAYAKNEENDVSIEKGRKENSTSMCRKYAQFR